MELSISCYWTGILRWRNRRKRNNFPHKRMNQTTTTKSMIDQKWRQGQMSCWHVLTKDRNRVVNLQVLKCCRKPPLSIACFWGISFAELVVFEMVVVCIKGSKISQLLLCLVESAAFRNVVVPGSHKVCSCLAAEPLPYMPTTTFLLWGDTFWIVIEIRCMHIHSAYA